MREASVLDGRAMVDDLLQKLKDRPDRFCRQHGRSLALAVILVGVVLVKLSQGAN